METREERLPAHWASALINGDCSGMEQDEIDTMEDFLTSESLNLWHCVDMTDEAEFELAPSYHPELLAGAYATFVFAQ